MNRLVFQYLKRIARCFPEDLAIVCTASGATNARDVSQFGTGDGFRTDCQFGHDVKIRRSMIAFPPIATAMFRGVAAVRTVAGTMIAHSDAVHSNVHITFAS